MQNILLDRDGTLATMRRMRSFSRSLLVGSMLLTTAAAQSDDRAAITATFEGFYSAMKAGDSAAAMRFVAPDAVFVEGGQVETRAEYEKSHLPADMGFERAVSGKRGPLTVTVNGESAWVVALTDYVGTFDGKPVNFVSAQLMVLTRSNSRWQIRSVHWSSRRR